MAWIHNTVMKAYQHVCSGRMTRFTSNLPGKDFAAGFLRRNKELRTTTFIESSIVMLSAEIVIEFF